MLGRICSPRLVSKRYNCRALVLSYVRYASRKTVRPFLLADIGEGITECEIIKWLAPTYSILFNISSIL